MLMGGVPSACESGRMPPVTISNNGPRLMSWHAWVRPIWAVGRITKDGQLSRGKLQHHHTLSQFPAPMREMHAIQV